MSKEEEIERLSRLWKLERLPYNVYQTLNKIRLHLANNRSLAAYDRWLQHAEQKHLPEEKVEEPPKEIKNEKPKKAKTRNSKSNKSQRKTA
jgi:hypothetical protein